MSRFDAAVIGSGPNGLSAAILLAHAGLSVVVYEAGATVGGGARSLELTEPGFLHDMCSAIHPMGIGSPYWRTLPLAEYGLEWLQPEAPLAHPLDDGSAVMQERSLEATAAGLGVDGKGWQRLMGPFVERWWELAQDAIAPLGIPKHPLLMARFGMRAFLPTTLLAGLFFHGERAKALFAGLAAHSVLPLGSSPSAAIGLMLGVAGHAVGWPMPRGGAQAIPDALASYFRSLGGQIVTDAPIESLAQIDSNGPVLFATSPAAMVKICGSALPSRYQRKIANYRYGPGLYKIDYALDEPIPWAAKDCARAATVHLGGTIAELTASELACWRKQHHDKPYVLVTQPSLFDPSRAPPGKHTAWAYCHVPAGSTEDMCDIIEAQIERYAPGFQDVVRARAKFNTADLQAYNANYIGGDVNGGAATLGQLFTRPVARLSPYSTPNKRVFLCSASTPPGGGVHGMCGFYAAKVALRRLGLG